MTSDALDFLLTPEGEAAIRDAASAGDTLAAVTRLRKRLDPESASAAALMTELRRRGAAKFSRADWMLFTRERLEMATGECIARWRARRFAGFDRAADLTCGIGGDALALAEHTPVVALDRDPLVLRMARHNAAVYGVEERFYPVCADSREWRPAVPALFIDPARRQEGKRLRRGEDLQPPLPVSLEWARGAQAAGIKLSPAFEWEPYAGEAEVELISDGGECREAVLWFGAAKTCRVRASLADREVTLQDRPTAPVPVRPVGTYLYEPDAAVRRAHLVETLAEEIGAWKLDPEIAYLSSETLVQTPFASAYAVVEAFPFRLKELQRRLRQRGVGRVVVKKRGVAYDPAEIERRLKLDGSDTAIVLLTRIGPAPVAMIANPV